MPPLAIRLPSGKQVLFSYAFARGWVDAQGNIIEANLDNNKAVGPLTSEGATVPPRKPRTSSNPSAPSATRARPKTGNATVTEVEPTEAGDKVRKPKVIKPLVPQNVDADGKPITDDAVLDEIAAKTAAIEAERKRLEAEAEAAADADVVEESEDGDADEA